MKHLAAWVFAITGVLMGQQFANAASDSEPSHFWGGVNLKYWMATYNPSSSLGEAKVNEAMPTVVVGYDRFFYTLTFQTQPNATSSTYPAGGIKLQDEAFGFGYNFSSNFALVIGQKAFAEVTAGTTPNRTKYNTIAAVFNWTIPDSKIVLFGNIATGKGKSAQGNITQAQTKYAFSGYEFGISYPILPSSKVSLGYKWEQMGLPFGTAGTLGIAEMSGLFTGISYSF